MIGATTFVVLIKPNNCIMKTISSKLLLCAIVLLTPIFLQAQYRVYPDQQVDHTYLTIEDIYEDEHSIQGAGYVISSTTFDSPSSLPMSGEIIRTGPTGNLLWTNQFTITSGPTDHRFNHIEKFFFNGQVEYLVVGSIVDGTATSTLLVAIVDDNGTVIASEEIVSASHDHLLGIKGIAVSDETFAITALEADGFTDADDKNIVILKLDRNLGLQNSMVISSPNNNEDYDTPTDIVEGENADQFFIIGTSNKNGTTSQPCAFAALVELPGNAVIWSHNYSTAIGAHWDVGADGYYDGEKLFVLGNSSIIHYFNLVELDAASGTVNNEIQYSDVTYGGDFNHYGYELKPALGQDATLIISGWKSIYSGDAVQPFLLEVNPNDASIVWHWKYNGYNNNQLNLNENNWLYLQAGAQFPYYYNDMMTYRQDRRGYAMLTTFAEGKESVFNWYGTNLTGDVNTECGYDTVDADSIIIPFYYNAPLAPVADNIQTGINSYLKEVSKSYNDIHCEWEKNKTGVISGLEEKLSSTYKVYPNPATNSLFVSGEDVKEVTVMDIFGRNIISQKANAQTQISIDVSGIRTGIYIVNITTTSGEVKPQKVEIIK